MNKSKLKLLISGMIAFNFLIGSKTFAAIRKTTPTQSGRSLNQNPTNSSTLNATGATFSRILRPHEPRGPIAILSKEEIERGLTSAKTLLNNGNYTMVPKLKDVLKFMKYSEESFKRDFNSLTNKDYYKTRYSRSHKNRIYVFDRNDSKDGNLYVKFSLSKDLKDLSIISYNNDKIKFEGAPHDAKDISMILGNANFTKLNLLGRSIDKSLIIAKNAVENKKYSKTSRTSSNLRELRYSNMDFKYVIKNLDKTDYIAGPEPTHEDTRRKDGSVWVFGYDDKKKGNELYIKFIIDDNENDVTFISFHPTDRPLNYFFKDMRK